MTPVVLAADTAAARRPRHGPVVARGHVRPVQASDLDGLVALYLHVHGEPPTGGADQARTYLGHLLFGHPWMAKDLPSLVYEDAEGRPAGLLAVVPRPMQQHGESLRLALGHHFMVAPASRSSLAAVELMRTFLAGPQDVSMFEACTPWRRLWEAMGGSVAVIPGLQWSRVLGPCRYGIGLATRKGLPAVGARLLGPIVSAGDRLAARLVPALRLAPSAGFTAHPIDADGCAAVSAWLPRQALHPVLDRGQAAWLLEHLHRKTHRGHLQGMVLRRADGAIAGWYLYYLKPHGVSQVVALQADRGHLDAAFDHLAQHAHTRGAGVLAGQGDREVLGTIGRRHGLIHQRADSWQLVHSRRPDLLHDIHAGDAVMSRLETDWWITY